MAAYGLKEYELQYAGLNSRSQLGFIVGRVQKPLAPQMSEVTQSVPGKYGNLYTGTNYEGLVFNIPITILADNAQEYNMKLENIRNTFINLYDDKNKEYPLVFGDRPELTYYGHWTSLPDPQFLTENDWDTQTTLQFTCSDPHGYMDKEVFQLNRNNEAVYPKGNSFTYPVYVLKLKKDVFNIGYADAESSQYVATGYTVDIDNTDEYGNKISNKEPLAVNEPETDLSSWSTDNAVTGAVKLDNGEIDGTLDMYAGWGLAPKRKSQKGLNSEGENITKEVFDFGNAKKHKNWYGPMAIHDNIPNPTTDWQMSVTLRHAQQYQRAMGKIEIYLLDENNQRRGKIWIKDQSHGRIPHVGIQIGTKSKNVEILKKDKADGSDESSNDYVGPKKIPGTNTDWINSSSGEKTITLKKQVKKATSSGTSKSSGNGSSSSSSSNKDSKSNKKTPKSAKEPAATSKGTSKTNTESHDNYDKNGHYTSTSIITHDYKKGIRTTLTIYKNGKRETHTVPIKKRSVSISDELKRRILKRGFNPKDLETRAKKTTKTKQTSAKATTKAKTAKSSNKSSSSKSTPPLIPMNAKQTKELQNQVKKAVSTDVNVMKNLNKEFDKKYGTDDNTTFTFNGDGSVTQTMDKTGVVVNTVQLKGGVEPNNKTKAEPVDDDGNLKSKDREVTYWADKHSAFTNFCGIFFLRKVGNHYSCWIQMKENQYGMPAGGVIGKRDFYDDNNEFDFALTSIGAWIAKYNITDDKTNPPYPYDDNKLSIEGFQTWNIFDGGNQATDEKKIIAQSGETIYIDTNQMKVFKENGTDLTKYTSFASSFPPLKGGAHNQLSFDPRPGDEADVFVEYRPRIK